MFSQVVSQKGIKQGEVFEVLMQHPGKQGTLKEVCFYEAVVAVVTLQCSCSVSS